eukprot:3525666-Amphidinium_carterae.1
MDDQVPDTGARPADWTGDDAAQAATDDAAQAAQPADPEAAQRTLQQEDIVGPESDVDIDLPPWI